MSNEGESERPPLLFSLLLSSCSLQYSFKSHNNAMTIRHHLTFVFPSLRFLFRIFATTMHGPSTMNRPIIVVFIQTICDDHFFFPVTYFLKKISGLHRTGVCSPNHHRAWQQQSRSQHRAGLSPAKNGMITTRQDLYRPSLIKNQPGRTITCRIWSKINQAGPSPVHIKKKNGPDCHRPTFNIHLDRAGLSPGELDKINRAGPSPADLLHIPTRPDRSVTGRLSKKNHRADVQYTSAGRDWTSTG